MKSFTKLAVLLLTLALLCTSVFTITAFAETAETATSLLQADANGTTSGSISNNAAQGDGKNRYGANTYRDLSQKTNGKLVEIVSRTLGEGETETGSAQIQYTMSGASGAALTSANYQYIVYDFEIGTYNEFFTRTGKGLYFTFGANSGKTGRFLYLYKDANGIIHLGTSANSGSVAILGTPDENGLEARVTVVLEMAATVAESKIYVFANGEYGGQTTLGADIASYSDPSMRLWMEADTSFTDYATKDMSVYLNYANITSVDGSSADVEGDLASIVNGALIVPADYVYGAILNQWKNSDSYVDINEADVVADENTVGVKIAADGAPIYAQLTVGDSIPDVFDWGTDVTLTLLEDMTYSPVKTLEDGTAASNATTTAAFTINTSGQKVFDLNEHTFTHNPLACYASDTATKKAARGYTFLLKEASVDLTVKNGTVIKEQSAWGFIREADAVTDGGSHNFEFNNVDITITGGMFNNKKQNVSHYTFIDTTYTAITADGSNIEASTSTPGFDGLTNAGCSATFTNSNLSVTVVGENADLTVNGGTVSFPGLASGSTLTVETGTVTVTSATASTIDVKGGTVVVTGDVADSTVTVSGEGTKFGAGVNAGLSAITSGKSMSSTTLTATGGAELQTNTLSGVTMNVTGGSLIVRGKTDNTTFTTDDLKLTFYAAVTGGSIDMTAGSLTFGSNVGTVSGCTIDIEETSFATTTTASKTTAFENCPITVKGGVFKLPTVTNTVTFNGCTVDVDGAELTTTALVKFVNCSSVSFKNATGSFGLVDYANASDEARGAVLYEKCVVKFNSGTRFLAYVDATVENCEITSGTNVFRTFKDDNGTYDGYTDGDDEDAKADEGTASSSTLYVVGTSWNMTGDTTYFIAGGDYSKVTIGEGTKANLTGTITGQAYNIAEGYYLALNDGEDAETYPYVVKAFDFSALEPTANLTLYSDIQFNLYLSIDAANYITAINGDALVNYAVRDAEDNILYYHVPYAVAAHAANEVITVTFNPVNKGNAKYNLTKTVSIADYIKLVYADSNLEDSYTLMSDLVDYVVATMTHFDANADVSDFDGLNDYASANESITGADDVDYEAVKGYIKGAYLNVEDSNTKFVFVAGTADTVTLSYTSATGKVVTETFENCAEGDKLVLEMRAYDLNAVINISVNGGAATGTYNLAAYANSEDAAGATDVLLEMYNYAVSAKAYKESLAAAND